MDLQHPLVDERDDAAPVRDSKTKIKKANALALLLLNPGCTSGLDRMHDEGSYWERVDNTQLAAVIH